MLGTCKLAQNFTNLTLKTEKLHRVRGAVVSQLGRGVFAPTGDEYTNIIKLIHTITYFY